MRLSDTLPILMRWDDDLPASTKEQTLERTSELGRFLIEVEKRAFRIARIALRNDDDALDIVQDSMLQLARRYGAHPSAEWRPLFYRILQNRIRDFQRRLRVRSKIMGWLPGRSVGEGEPADVYDGVPDSAALPLEQLETDQAMHTLEAALAQLPARQQEAFMLRNFEGLNVAETAVAMRCAEGSVKTHYSRAVHALRAALRIV